MKPKAKRKISQALSVSTKIAFCWFERFRNGDFSLEDEQRSGRLTNIDLSELMGVIESTLCTLYYQFKHIRLVSKLGITRPKS